MKRIHLECGSLLPLCNLPQICSVRQITKRQQAAALQGALRARVAQKAVLLFCLLLGFGSVLPAVETEGRWAILIAGASGDPDLQKLYLKEIRDLRSTLEKGYGFPPDHITVLFDDPSKAPDIIQYKSDRESLQAVCHKLSAAVKKNDLMLVFIEGHGDYDGKVYKLNLVGPDPTAEELAGMLYKIPARFVIVNATNCSGGSIPALSRKGTVLMTSTKSGMEKNQTHFGQYFVEAFADDAADSDKNGRVSMLEAFQYASHRVEDYYNKEGSLQSEHPVLDDTGDGHAEAVPAPENGKGLLSKTMFLDSGVPAASAQAKTTPEQQKLSVDAKELEKQIEALKYSKSRMPEDEYEKKLEELLLKLAQINAQLSK